MVRSVKLSDGTSIPWLAYGNGSGQAGGKSSEGFSRLGQQALDAGFVHIDTAQGYGGEQQEGETGRLLEASDPEYKIYVTSKLSQLKGFTECQPIDSIKESVASSTKKLGRVPNLWLLHNPFVTGSGEGRPDELVATWKILEELKDDGKLFSIGVSNFRPQDLEAILKDCKHPPVVNQIEFHPYLLAHLKPVLDIHKKHGIVTESYGPLTPILRNKGGRLDNVLSKIAERVKKDAGSAAVDETSVLLLWIRAVGAVAVTTSGNSDRIKNLAAVDALPDLTEEEVEKINTIGKQVHFRNYTEHMEQEFPVPKLPSK